MRNIIALFACSLWLAGCQLPTDVTGASHSTPHKSINVGAEAAIFHKKAPDLNIKPLKAALNAYQNAQSMGIKSKPYVTVIDYSLASNKKRLWVLDLEHHTVPFYTYVAHGKNSGVVTATHFSNQNGSKESSIGTFLTANTYTGHKGYSLRLQGLESKFNSNAMSRAVVIHGADYANPEFIKAHGRAGLSWGCPAIPVAKVKPLINAIKSGSLVVAYYPDSKWLSQSRFVK
jgi:hypothetical protein